MLATISQTLGISCIRCIGQGFESQLKHDFFFQAQWLFATAKVNNVSSCPRSSVSSGIDLHLFKAELHTCALRARECS